MWMLGLLVFYALHRILVVWYLTLWNKRRIYQPYYWDSPIYQATVLFISVALLILSMFLFSRTSSWLTLMPLVFISASIYQWRQKRGRQLCLTIMEAVSLDRRLVDEGKPRSTINRQIVQHFLGSAPSERWTLEDDDLGEVLKFCILPELGLYRVDTDLALMNKPGAVMRGGKQIDELIEFYEDALIVAKTLASRAHPETRE